MSEERSPGTLRNLRGVRTVLGMGWLLLPLVAVGQAPPRAEPVRPAVPVVPGEPVRPAVPVEGAKTPEDDLWEYASLLYSRQEYGLAAQQLVKFLEVYPGSANVGQGYFRLGECYLRLKDEARAEGAYVELLRRIKKGDAAGSAAYRMGSMRYNGARFEEAAQYYALAETESEKAEVRLSSGYFRARSMERLGKNAEALAAYGKLALIEENNPYQVNALRVVAAHQMEKGEKEAALANFIKIAQNPGAAGKAGILAEALVKAGMIYSEKGNPEDAIPWFDKALSLEDPQGEAKEWKAIASYSAVRSYYEAGKYDAVIRAYQGSGGAVLSEETQPKMLLWAANSYRKLERNREAVDLYLKLEEDYPESPEALEGAYRKLISFHDMKSPRLAEFVDAFLERYGQRFADHEFVDRAMLLKAEGLYSTEEFAAAAEYYGKVRVENVPESLRASVVYKTGWAQAEGGMPEKAVDSFTKYLGTYATEGNADMALAKRAMAYKDVKDYPNALKDLERVVAEFPGSPTVEMALQQAALIKGETRDLEGMVKDFGLLLEKYPTSVAAAEANYWIGWAYFEMKKFEEAVGALRKAEEMDPESYGAKAALRLVLCHYYMEDVEGLANELSRYIKENGATNIPTDVLFWCGVEKFKAGDYLTADRYLTLGAAPAPDKAPAVVWDNMARARIAVGNFKEAVEAIDQYLLDESKTGGLVAKAQLVRAQALLGMKDYDAATESCAKGLEKVKEGRVNAELTICQGDIALAAGQALQEVGKNAEAAVKYREAVGHFVRVSQVFVDRVITPEAMSKWAIALDRLGENEKAKEVRAQLKASYPDFKLSAGS